ncbi:hypothetical protein PAMP_005592 [Pampus punctatissimus]
MRGLYELSPKTLYKEALPLQSLSVNTDTKETPSQGQSSPSPEPVRAAEVSHAGIRHRRGINELPRAISLYVHKDSRCSGSVPGGSRSSAAGEDPTQTSSSSEESRAEAESQQ